MVGIDGTEKDNIMEAELVHLNCLELILYKMSNGNYFIGQSVVKKDGNV